MASSIFTRFLKSLGVPHTQCYSDSQFRSMTFKSLFGLSHLLRSYGVDSEGIKVGDKTELTRIGTPFLAQMQSGQFVIVTDTDSVARTVAYDSAGSAESTSVENFERAWNGIALLAFPSGKSREPDYRSHLLTEIVSRSTKYLLLVALLGVFAYFFITRRIYADISAILIAVFDCVGLYFSYLLLQKSLGIHTAASDRVCGVLERGGCDQIVSMKVSKLFGVFSWSEVGFGYFGVSLATLLLFPHLWPELALCNVCCLPYTFWSIWYQRFRAHHWCTLCVGVQTTLWILFFCYLGGGWLQKCLPLRFDLLPLIGTYIGAVLLLNMTLRIFKHIPCDEKNSPS